MTRAYWKRMVTFSKEGRTENAAKDTDNFLSR
jgi:hypothetical protein